MPSFPAFPDSRAIRAIERRGMHFLPSGDWQTVWQEQHQTAFTVAQSAGFDILADIYAGVLKAMSEGTTFEKFRENLTPLLQQKGWWGRDEATGRQLGSPWRLKTIFQTNLRVSAARSDWQVIQELKEKRPYLCYVALKDSRTRPLHASWDDVVLPVDHPWWNTHFPPNGWNCRCKTISLDEDDLALHGLKVRDHAPDDGYREWRNRITGEILEIPKGIDPGWAYNPGKVDQAAHVARLAMEKLAELPPEMGTSAITRLALSFPQVEAELKGWIGGITAQLAQGIFRPTGSRRVVGALPDEAIAFAKKNGIKLATAAISIGDRDLMHALRTDKFMPLPVEVWENLPSLLFRPDAIYWDMDANTLSYVIGGDSGKIIIQLNNLEKVKDLVDGKRKKKQILTNTVRSGRRVKSMKEFEDRRRYARLK